MVSFTFDDVPKSAVANGAPILEEYGARGTFYISGGLVDQWPGHWTGVSADEIVTLHRRGHEDRLPHLFACAGNRSRCGGDDAARSRRTAAISWRSTPSIRIENFAYPYGFASVSRKRQLGKAFRSSRGILPGVNSGAIDLQFLRATPLIETNIDRDGIDRAFDEAVARNGWLIFYSHDVEGCTQPLRMLADHAAPCAGGGIAPENPDPECRAGAQARRSVRAFARPSRRLRSLRRS